jgi:hypothetical protein
MSERLATGSSSSSSGSGDLHFIFNQLVPSAIWNVTHNLNKYPSVTVVDSGGTIVVGDINYIDTNNLTITFSFIFSGKAYMN